MAVLNTGVKLIQLEDETGYAFAQIRLNPTDANMISRYEEVVDFFNNFQELLPEDSEPTKEETIKLNELIADKIDYLVGYGAGREIFSYCGALTVTGDGEVFFMNVLDFIAKEIEEATNNRMKKVNSAMKKYTDKYKK